MNVSTRMSAALRGVAVASITVIALAGCSGNSDSAAESTAAADSLLPAAEGKTVYPLTVDTATGPAVIEERPERVVMASSWDADLFAALGVTPVGTDEQIDFYPWAVEKIPGEIETVWPIGDTAYPAEQVANTTPDLVVDTLAADPVDTEQLADIAPVVGAPAGIEAPLWEDRLRLLGEALDLSDRAEQFIDEYGTTFENIRAEHPEFEGKTVDYLVYWGGGSGTGFMNTIDSEPEALLTSFGFAENTNAAVLPQDGELSDELLGTLTGDVLVISNQAADQAEFDAWYSSPLLQRLPSVQEGRTVILNLAADNTVTYDGERQDFTGHFGRAWSVGPLAHEELADLLVPKLSAVLT
ncbi:ABC transporter substrate-binding protein [Rhodococcus sp. NPDC057297]|uniref:ABC transporter substrate-binding protein n=1 Tax=Rhodococcus sp. NPDC057297 TaxID=3346090 RepID=UPI003629B3EB